MTRPTTTGKAQDLITFTRSTTGTALAKISYGEELVTNGDFSNGTTGWNFRTETPESGKARLNNTSLGNITYYNQTAVGEVGKAYVLTYDVLATNGATLALQQATNLSLDTTTTGSKRLTFNWSRVGGALTIKRLTSNTDVTIDNISVTEIQGSHATQPTSTQRPIYARHPEGGIRNLLNYTEQFDNGAWQKSNSTILPNQITSPSGEQTASLYTNIGSSGSSFIGVQTIGTSGKGYTASVYAKAGTNNIIRIGNVSSSLSGCWYNLTNGTIGTDNGSGNTSSIQDVGNGWYRCTRYFASWAVGGTELFVGNSLVDGSFQPPSTSKNVYLWGAQFEEATEASNYQKRVTDIDVTESGVGEVYYLKFDGVSDGMKINNLTSPNTPLTAWFGYSATNADAGNAYKRLLDIQTGRTLLGASTTAGSIGYFDGAWRSFAADTNAIKVLTYDLVENNAKIRIDGTQEYSDTTYDQRAIGGTIGLFQEYTQTQQHLGGNLYSCILRAAESTDKEIASTESYVAKKTGVLAQVDGIATLSLDFGGNNYTARNSNGGIL